LKVEDVVLEELASGVGDIRAEFMKDGCEGLLQNMLGKGACGVNLMMFTMCSHHMLSITHNYLNDSKY